MYQQFLPELEERFLRYVQIHTASEENSPTAPSTPRQFELLNLLVEELRRHRRARGAADRLRRRSGDDPGA